MGSMPAWQPSHEALDGALAGLRLGLLGAGRAHAAGHDAAHDDGQREDRAQNAGHGQPATGP